MAEKKIDKTKKVKKNEGKKNIFNFKDWLKSVIEKNESRRKSNSVSKIDAPFKMLVVQCEKGIADTICNEFSALGIQMAMILNSFQVPCDSKVKALAISNREGEMVFGLFSSDAYDGKIIEVISQKMHEKNIENFFAYVVTPSGADLNLIYLLKREI